MNLASAERGLTAQGKQELIAYLQGKAIPRSRAMKAKCFECMGGYADGKVDCRIPACPLYPWMPFNPNRRVQTPKNLNDGEIEAVEEGEESQGSTEGVEPPETQPVTPPPQSSET